LEGFRVANSLSSDSRFDDFRRQMPVVGKWAFFDHAACAPLTGPARDALAKWLVEAAEEGGTAWGRWDRRIEEVRRTAAKFIGATPEEIALVRSTTDGIMLVAEGFPWREGDNVVIPAEEFPTNQYAWINLVSRGVECRRVPMESGRTELDKLDAACDGRTRIVALSWVGFLNGWRTDLAAAAEMAHRRGALLFVDGIQALGAFPIDVEQTGIDFLAAGGQKWMLSPEGTGLLYIRRQHLNSLRPIGIGSHSVVDRGNYTHIELRLKDSASRYEGGGPNSSGLAAYGASLDLLAALGSEAVGQRIIEITDICIERLKSMGARLMFRRGAAENCSGIVTFELPGCDPRLLVKHCQSQKVAVAFRAGGIRISPHAYIDNSDIEQFFAALTEGQQICKRTG
jgi:selenocysteine lyase/cysteine desulfurase